MYEGAFFKAYLTPITPNVKKMVRHKVVQQILQDFKSVYSHFVDTRCCEVKI